MTGPGIHSEHGASSAYRWTNCPGSVALSRGIPRSDTDYSREGTAAHALAELAHRRLKHPDFWLGEIVEGVEVTEDMADAVRIYLDYLQDLITLDDEVHVEHRVSLERLNPPVPMYGTCDMLVYRRTEKKLWVIDYKHGKGVPVDVTGNKQLRYYALGALLSLDASQPVDEVEAVIVQPRAPHKDGPIRSETFAPGDLLDFASDLLEAVHLSMQPDAPLRAGDHCKFCPASARCPARRDHSMEIAKSEFDAPAMPDPRLLAPTEVGELLSKVDMVEDWIRALRAHALGEMEAGRAVPGWKLVAKRPMRRWAVPEADIVARLGDVKDALYEEPKLRSPAQIEKLVGKKRFPADLVASVSSGVTLAPEHDKRPAAAVSAATEFEAIGVSDDL